MFVSIICSLGTPCIDNMEDCKSKGRFRNQKKTHCSKGHPFSKESTYTSVPNQKEMQDLL